MKAPAPTHCSRLLPLVTLLAVATPFGACAPVFSDLQSARLTGQGRVEVTPSGSMLFFSGEDGTDHVEDHYGVQIATGVHPRADVRLRYEKVSGDDVNVLGFGPKLGLKHDRLALALPVGFAFGKAIDAGETWEFHPTLVFTQPLSASAELNASAKLLIPIGGAGRDTTWAVNLGLGLGRLDRFVVRPEVGWLFNPGDDGHYLHASLGLTFYAGQSRSAAPRGAHTAGDGGSR